VGMCSFCGYVVGMFHVCCMNVMAKLWMCCEMLWLCGRCLARTLWACSGILQVCWWYVVGM